MAKPVSEDSWFTEVDRQLRRDWCISAADAGLSREELKRHWAEGLSPFDFVEWFAEKYDLIRFEPPLTTRRRI